MEAFKVSLQPNFNVTNTSTTTSGIFSTETLETTAKVPLDISTETKILTLYAYPTVCTFGMVTNALTLLVLHRNVLLSMCDKTVYALCVVDTVALICVGFNNGLQMALMLEPNVVQSIANLVNETWMSIMLLLSRIPLHVSKFITAFISLERLVAISCPFKAKWFWKRRGPVSATWIASIAILCYFCMNALFARIGVSGGLLRMERTEFAINHEVVFGIYGIISLGMLNLPPICVLVFTAITIAFIWRRQKKLANMTFEQRCTVQQVLKTSKALLTVTSVFALTELPGLIALFVVTFTKSNSADHEFMNMAMMLISMVNSTINGVLYLLLTPRFKKDLTRIFSVRSCSNILRENDGSFDHGS